MQCWAMRAMAATIRGHCTEQSGSMVSVFSIPRGEVHEQEMLQEGQALQGMSAARKVSRNPARC